MKIIIVGAGRIGSNLSQALSEENHEVYLIENDDFAARKAEEKLDVKVILGQGSDPEILKAAQVADADLVIAVTPSDETNFVVCSLASFFGAKRQIARIRNTALSRALGEKGYEYFHVDECINPEEVAAQAIGRAIDTPGAAEVGDFAGGRILLRGFDIDDDSNLCGTQIGDLNLDDFPWPFLVVAIRRDNAVVIPKGDTIVKKEDRIYVLLLAQSLSEFLAFVKTSHKKPSKVIIYGATHTGTRVAEFLKERVRDIALIEEDPLRAEKIATALPFVRVINGSGCEKDILVECGVEAADAFIATSKNDHSNLVSAVLAKDMGAQSTIITTQQPDYMSIIDSLDIDVIINPHLLAVDRIISIVRGKTVNAVTKLLDCDAEALEFIVEPGAPVTKAPLKEMEFPKNSLIGAVSRGEEAFLAKGDTQISAGDKVIVFCLEKSARKVESCFIRKKLF